MSELIATLPSALPRHGLLFVYALLFALAEIEIEGARGWAEALPTWYRVTPWYARLFRFVMSGKPLTGYHAVMLPLTFTSFHMGFGFGQTWTMQAEAVVIARFLFWIMVWDLIWFLFNPAFGWRRFRPGQVWWLGKRWFGGFPQEYWSGAAVSFAVAAWGHGKQSVAAALLEHTVYGASLVVMTVGICVAIPSYQRWYQHMRRPGADERGLAIPPSRQPSA